MKLKLKKGDTVQVMAGKDKGRRGKILAVQPDKTRIKVEKLNMVKRHTRATQANPSGGIVERENWLHLSNVMLVDPKTDKPTRVGRRVEGQGAEARIVRVAIKSGTKLD